MSSVAYDTRLKFNFLKPDLKFTHEVYIQVVAILESQSDDPLPFTIQAADLDLPELQGEPEDIAKEKCRLAAQQVRFPTPQNLLSKTINLVLHSLLV